MSIIKFFWKIEDKFKKSYWKRLIFNSGCAIINAHKNYLKKLHYGGIDFMRILILSCNTGGGHNSAAAALKEYFDSKNIFCEVRDALAFDSRLKSDIISKGDILLYKKAPKLFAFGYRFAEKHPSKPGYESLMYTIMKSGTEKLYDYLCDNDFQAVLCTHVFAGMMMTEIRKRYDSDVRFYFVATDYASYPGIEEVHADAYFIANKNLIPDYMDYGISENALIPVGIPIKRAFYKSLSKERAKEILGLPQDKRAVLLMCGSIGCGPIYNLGMKILKKLPDDTVLVVICGSNEKLFKKFQKYTGSDNLHVVGYTNKMNIYMDACDMVVTKPGGLSSTESATKLLPMVLMGEPVACEVRNMEFFLKNDFAVTSDTLDGLADETAALLNDSEKMSEVIDLLKSTFSIYSAGVIGDYVIAAADNDLEFGELVLQD